MKWLWMVLCLVGCQQSTPPAPKTIHYFNDTRTHLCLATTGQNVAYVFIYPYDPITNVPCTPEVEALIATQNQP